MEPMLVIMLLAASFSQEQPKYTEYGQVTERGGTRIAYWNNEKNQAAGQVAIEFGHPAWKPEYDGQLDAMTTGKTWRMGENFWTTFDANIEVSIGGVDVPAGYYYLVVRRSDDGSEWTLVFLDPAGVRNETLDPYEVGARAAELPVLFEAPLVFEKRDDVSDRLAIELSEDNFVLRWGTFALSSTVAVSPR